MQGVLILKLDIVLAGITPFKGGFTGSFLERNSIWASLEEEELPATRLVGAVWPGAN